jgi:hypothetical protein
MIVRIRLLCLILVVMNAWSDGPQSAALIRAAKPGILSGGQEMFPVALRYRAELDSRIAEHKEVRAFLPLAFLGSRRHDLPASMIGQVSDWHFSLLALSDLLMSMLR